MSPIRRDVDPDDRGVLGDRRERALVAGQQGDNLVQVGGTVSGEQRGADRCRFAGEVNEDTASVGDGFRKDSDSSGEREMGSARRAFTPEYKEQSVAFVLDGWPWLWLYDCRRQELRSVRLRGSRATRTTMGDQDEEWRRKGATLSDKTARAEFGLTQDEIVEAIRAGTLHYRRGSMHRNPWLRLLRREVEQLVTTRHDDRYLKERQATAELKRVNRELKRLRAEVASLEERRSTLMSDLAE